MRPTQTAAEQPGLMRRRRRNAWRKSTKKKTMVVKKRSELSLASGRTGAALGHAGPALGAHAAKHTCTESAPVSEAAPPEVEIQRTSATASRSANPGVPALLPSSPCL